MTTARRRRKTVSPIGMMAGAALLLLGIPLPLPQVQAATTERIVVDPNRGLALNGFDPVAYFTDGKPLLGREDLEYAYAGTVFRFRNEGNRAAFADNPEVY